MITGKEIERLFNKRDLREERRERLNRKSFPPVVQVPIEFDSDKLLQEFKRLKKIQERELVYIYEDHVIGDALDLRERISRDCADYFPLILTQPTDDALEIQNLIDSRRGIYWVEHQKQLSSARRVRSMMDLNQDYDPLIDERTCKKFSEGVFSGYLAELFENILAIPTRTRFVYLKAGDEVRVHIDNDPLYIVRIHFPIITNKDCYNGFLLKGKAYEYQMLPGQAYMVNNGIPHWGRNSGESDRLHLVVSLDGQEDYLKRQEKCRFPLLVNRLGVYNEKKSSN